MTEPPVPTPAPAKKGLSPLAWIAIGCGGLVVVGGLILVALISFGVYKGKQFVDNMESQPVTTTAKAFALLNPEVEFVSADEESRTATFRNEKTGETVTVSLEDIENGKISFTTDEGTVNIEAQGGEDGGALTVTNEEGTTVFKSGAGSAVEIPDWVPLYPGAQVGGAYAMHGEQGEQGTFTVTTQDPLEDLVDFYRRKLEDAGYTIETTSFEGGGVTQRSLTGTEEDSQSRITVLVSAGDEGTQAVVQYSRGNL